MAHAFEVWAEDQAALCQLGDALVARGEHAQGFACFDAAERSSHDVTTPRWRRACTCARAGLWSAAETALDALLEREPNAYFAVLLDAVRRQRGDAPTLETLRRARPDARPALLWGLLHERARTLGDDALARGLQERLFALPPAELLDACWFFVRHELPLDARALLELLRAHPRAQPAWADAQRAEVCVELAAGAPLRAAELALALHREHARLPVFDDEIKAAREARSAEALHTLAHQRLQYILRGGGLDWGDGMRERGSIALAALWRGDRQALTALLERYPAHAALQELRQAAQESST
jgi:hypothetical protein